MRVISVINLKGGVAKTTTVHNMAYALWKKFGKRVLVIDNDKQGNISKAFGVYKCDEEHTVADLMLNRLPDVAISEQVIHATRYAGIDIIPSNMKLLQANLAVMMDVCRQQQDRFEESFLSLELEDKYDFVIIDNAPDINISIMNALRVTDDIIIPVQMDEYSFDGLDILLGQISQVRNDLKKTGHKLPVLAGCLCTYFQRDGINLQALITLREAALPVYNTTIRFTNSKPKEAISERKALMEYSVRCGAAQDYKHWVEEYVTQIG